MLNIAKLINHITCDKNTGDLYWKQTGPGRKMGVPIGRRRLSSRGVPICEVHFDGISYQNKYLFYVLCTRKIPVGKIGHLDGDLSNIAFNNLYDKGLMEQLERLVA